MIAKMWNDFNDEYPDIAAPVLSRLRAEHARHEAEMKNAHNRAFQEAMEVCYPHWDEVCNSKAFRRWLQQDSGRMEATHTPGVRAALKLLREFDEDMGRGRRLPAGGDEGMALDDSLPPARQPRGADPYVSMAG